MACCGPIVVMVVMKQNSGYCNTADWPLSWLPSPSLLPFSMGGRRALVCFSALPYPLIAFHPAMINPAPVLPPYCSALTAPFFEKQEGARGDACWHRAFASDVFSHLATPTLPTPRPRPEVSPPSSPRRGHRASDRPASLPFYSTPPLLAPLPNAYVC